MKPSRLLALVVLQFLLFLPAWSADRTVERYAIVLPSPPVLEELADAKMLRTAAAEDRARRIEAEQAGLLGELEKSGVEVLNTTRYLVNAIYVRTSPEEAARLERLPGVARVERMAPMRRHDQNAATLVRASQAWARVNGGAANAGAGVKIGILDSGIDKDHPTLRDATISAPAGFPKCVPADCGYTSGKVIVARSYVKQLAGSNATTSRPDDLSPRDRVGHGTAIASLAAGVQNAGPAGVVTGIAPKAWVGNYKIFGSPGVNDYTFTNVMVAALEDAVLDGMDIVTMSLGSPALYGPQDTGAACRLNPGVPCDTRAQAVQNAVRSGVLVVVSAGNTGDLGQKFPSYGSIASPGTAPLALTVGATTNSRTFYSTVSVPGGPSNLTNIQALFGDGPLPKAPLTAPLKDVALLENNGLACTPLASGSLAGAVALVRRGSCGFAIKANNVQKAGAVAMLLYQSAGSDYIFPPSGLMGTGIPTVMIGDTPGMALKNQLTNNPATQVTLNPAWREFPAEADVVADFSSRGPSIDENAIKPEMAAPGVGLYAATQTYDPNADLYDPTGYRPMQGTSFTAPLAAGAAALIKQRSSSYSPAQLKSSLVNTTNPEVFEYFANNTRGPAEVEGTGSGRLDAEAAIRNFVTMVPPTLSFGELRAPYGPNPPVSIDVTFRNNGTQAVNLTLTDTGNRLQISPANLNLAAGATASVRFTVAQANNAGSYQGLIRVTGGPVTLWIPYLYLVRSNQVFNAFALLGDGFEGVIGEEIIGRLIAVKVMDQYGLPVEGATVRFRTTLGGGRIVEADERTDIYGIAAAVPRLGAQVGEQEFTAEVGDLVVPFGGFARREPAIRTGGVVNAASNLVGRGLAPGSYFSIYGDALSDTLRSVSTTYLPLSLARVSVSFDTADGAISVPGRLHFVSENQVNGYIPWELAGRNSVRMKVSIGDISSALYDVPLASHSPAFFEITDPGDGRMIIAALDVSFRLIFSGNRARRGQAIQLYANGLGPLNNAPASGDPAPASPLATTVHQPEVKIGGVPAQVLFSGLAPGFVALYQVNVIPAANTPVGTQDVELTINGFTSKIARLPIE